MKQYTSDMLTKKDWQDALDIQDAVNLSGVVFAFARIMQRVCDEAVIAGQGTAWRNQHPLVQLIADKIVDLARVRFSASYTAAYEEVTRRISEWESELLVVESSSDGRTWSLVGEMPRSMYEEMLRQHDTTPGFLRGVAKRDQATILEMIIRQD